MAVSSVILQARTINVRRLKTHKKSRKGCGNCKLRKVKVGFPNLVLWIALIAWQCDEQKPSCNRCEAYGTLCDYSSPSSDLQSAARGLSSVNILQWPVLSHSQMVLGFINRATGSSTSESSPRSSQSSCEQYDFSSQDLEILYRFHTRTVLTLGSSNVWIANQYVYSKLTYAVSLQDLFVVSRI